MNQMKTANRQRIEQYIATALIIVPAIVFTEILLTMLSHVVWYPFRSLRSSGYWLKAFVEVVQARPCCGFRMTHYPQRRNLQFTI